MKVLCLSQNPLPDSRVEKSGLTASKAGHSVFFAGPGADPAYNNDGSFEKIFTLPFSRCANLGIPPDWNRLKKKFSELLGNVKPDIIHAHNLVAGKLALLSGRQYIYDDHEFWSLILKAARRMKWYHGLTQPYKRWLARRREDQVLENASGVIVISEQMAEYHRRKNPHVQVVPNYPLKAESLGLEVGSEKPGVLSSVYVGSDCSQPVLAPYRDVSGLLDIFRKNPAGKLTVIGDGKLVGLSPVYSLGMLPHAEMMMELTKHHIGLLPWKKHWIHSYANPNKPYEYAHAGLLNLIISDAEPVINTLGNHARTFNNYEELRKILIDYSENMGQVSGLKNTIRNFALDNLVWEKNEKRILTLYGA